MKGSNSGSSVWVTAAPKCFEKRSDCMGFAPAASLMGMEKTVRELSPESIFLVGRGTGRKDAVDVWASRDTSYYCRDRHPPFSHPRPQSKCADEVCRWGRRPWIAAGKGLRESDTLRSHNQHWAAVVVSSH